MHLRTDTKANAHFARVPTISRSRNAFSIAEKHVTTCQFDKLVPIWHKYIYPGDTLSISLGILARLQTQGYVLYDDLYFDIQAWCVPLRLIQENWARYQFNAQPGGPTQDNSALTSPGLTLSGLTTGFAAKSNYDYLGFPTGVNLSASSMHINNYLGRAIHTIWNENYRDENLQNPVTVDLDDGPDDPAVYSSLLPRGKRHDKFTSALKQAQKGTPMPLPLGTTAPVYGVMLKDSPLANQHRYQFMEGSTRQVTEIQVNGGGSPGAATLWGPNTASGGVGFSLGTPSDYSGGAQPPYADLASASAATLNQVRQSFAIQHFLEADARGGTRDVESIQHRWGVTVPDFRLQRPEYLGGMTFSFDGHIVPQTSETDGTPQGNLTQFSQAISSFRLNHSFVEHSVVIIFLSARSNITYQQGLARELSYRTKLDWYQPEFANLGEVVVKNKEIYCSGVDADDEGNFGYQEYAYELRYSENRVTSEMRSNYPTSLDVKHMADDYVSLPTLGSAWIQSDTPIGRNIVVQPNVADPIELNMFAQGRIARTLPMYSIPGLMRL